MSGVFSMELDIIQPSQLYINTDKLSHVMKEFDPQNPEMLRPVPIKRLGDDIIFTDGHTRAFAAYMAGLPEIRVFWDEDDLDWEAYAICMDWCKEAEIYTIADLKDRVVSNGDYKVLWHKRCEVMHRKLEAKRRGKDE